jgi:hypothetical protein
VPLYRGVAVSSSSCWPDITGILHCEARTLCPLTPDSAMKWDVESLRVSVFFVPPGLATFDSLLGAIARVEPEVVSERPKINKSEVGRAPSGHFFLTQQRERIDLLLGVRGDQAPPEDVSFYNVGSYEKAKEILFEPAKRLVEFQGAAISRVAFGAILLANVSDRIEGYKMLTPLLPSIKVDPANSEELFWQINRPRASSVLNTIRINRISKWSVLNAQRMLFQMSPEASIATAASPVMTAVKADLEANTPVSDAALPKDRLKDILEELWLAVEELSVKGDVP